MEMFTGNIPNDWSTTTPDAISQVTQRGRIHSGASAVNLSDGALLTQEVGVTPGCFYELSFFAKGDGVQVSVTATVTFGTVTGATIHAAMQDISDNDRNFTYYKAITTAVPAGVTTATIRFAVTATGGQSLDLDDVSFSVS